MEVKCLDAWAIYLGQIISQCLRALCQENYQNSVSHGAATKLGET